MSTSNKHFAPLARLLHWLMALMIIAMLFIGAGLAASVSERHEWLLNLHKPLGIAILLLVIVRLFVRFTTHQPALPADLPAVQVLAAKLSHVLLYALMFSLPLIGWAMISAAGDPVMLSSSLQLPSILPANPSTFAFLRKTHTWRICCFLPCWRIWRQRCSTAGCAVTGCWKAWCGARIEDPVVAAEA